MSTALNQRSPVAKAGWLIGLFMVGWLAFLFIPWPGRKPPPEPMPRMVVKPPSKLQAVGLPDNPDFEGLPEFFAVYAERADWVYDRALFAYWCPGTKDYSYFFEAIRAKGEIRFKEISRPADYYPEYYASAVAADQFPIRLIQQFRTAIPVNLADAPKIPTGDKSDRERPRIPIDLGTQPIKPSIPLDHAKENPNDEPKR